MSSTADLDDYDRLRSRYERLRDQYELLERDYKERLSQDPKSQDTARVYRELIATRQDAERLYAELQRRHRSLGASQKGWP